VVIGIGIGAALFLGVGWVLQQRIATRSESSSLMSWEVLRELIGSLQWWGGILAMTIGQALSAWALQLGPLSLVEPLLVTYLLFAFIVSAILARHRVEWQEVAGCLVLVGSVALFLLIANPKINKQFMVGWVVLAVACASIAAVALVLVLVAKTVGKRISIAVECAVLAAAAGLLYGLQDATTRGAIVEIRHKALLSLLGTPWPYLVVASATAGVLLTQSAFRAGRLDYALPPTATMQPIAGVALGVGLLGDRLSTTGFGIPGEVLCLAAMLAAVALIGRSPALAADPSEAPQRATPR
jgi:uncharacterized membrane protein